MAAFPGWWDWELEFTPHLLRRMVDRGFTETDLRDMLERARSVAPSAMFGRWEASCTHGGRAWTVVLEPIDAEVRVLVITAYPCGDS
jgi:hypothetical protein